MLKILTKTKLRVLNSMSTSKMRENEVLMLKTWIYYGQVEYAIAYLSNKEIDLYQMTSTHKQLELTM